MRNYEPFAQIELNFVLDDPRYRGLPVAARAVYLAYWCLAVRLRREVIPSEYSVAEMARLAGVHYTTCAKSAALLREKCMLEETAEGLVRVCGVKDLHPRLAWKSGARTRQSRVLKELTDSNCKERATNESKTKKTTAVQGALPIPRVGQPVSGVTMTAAAVRARQALLAKAGDMMLQDAVAELGRVTLGMGPRQVQDVERAMYADLVGFLTALHHAIRARNPAALMTAFMRGKCRAEPTDEACRWRERMRSTNGRKAVNNDG